MVTLVHDLIHASVRKHPRRTALICGTHQVTYGDLWTAIQGFAQTVRADGIGRHDRLAIYTEKRIENVVAMFGASLAGAVFVPVNPALKAAQVSHILRDCSVRMLITTSERLLALEPVLKDCRSLAAIILADDAETDAFRIDSVRISRWERVNTPRGAAGTRPPPVIDADMAAILYTSGSTGNPKGVVLSHRNLVAGARSVAEYLEVTKDDRLLCVLPLSFDYGLNQLTTAFLTGATAVLINHLFPRDIVNAVKKHRITGLAAVPPLWIQLAEAEWPEEARSNLRYITNSGGAMPRETLARLRSLLPSTQPYLMYGLTEAFRSTYLHPLELDRRPDSIGKAIPNAEVLVLRADGGRCAPGEPGELVHRGVHVALGYWNDPEKTAERFRPVPGAFEELPIPEIAVWSGDMVRTDDEGFLYFVGRRDEMIKTSGYRVSPTEIEQIFYDSGLVGEAVAFGIAHAHLGQAIAVIATAAAGNETTVGMLQKICNEELPAYMVPKYIKLVEGQLPRNPNGKIDRKALAAAHAEVSPS